jgi:HAD superfamily hydrolase (TIGR01490 family)
MPIDTGRIKLAIYDLDGTLCKKDTFKLFFAHLVRKGLIGSGLFFSVLCDYLLFIVGMVDIRKVKEKVLFALEGRSSGEIGRIADGFLDTLSDRSYRKELVESMQDEKQDGYMPVLLTASPDIYAVKIGKKFGFKKVLSTRTGFRNGRFSGKILGENLYGEEKLKILRKTFDVKTYDFSSSRGYGNRDDTPWLNFLGYAKIYRRK